MPWRSDPYAECCGENAATALRRLAPSGRFERWRRPLAALTTSRVRNYVSPNLSAERTQEVSDVGGEPVGHLGEGHVADVVVHLQPAVGDRLLRGEEVAQRDVAVAVSAEEKAREPEAARRR